MKISTEIHSCSRLVGEEKAVEYMAKAGFDAWDFSMFSMCKYDWNNKTLLANDHPLAGKDYLAFARKLKQIGLDNGIVCNQSHAPFPSYCDDIRSYIKRAIECTAEAGGQICIVHPDNYKGAEENAQMYMEWMEFAKECNVKIATENMFGWDKEKDQADPHACATPESFNAHLDAVNDPYFVACLDIGHAQMKGIGTSAEELILALGSRLEALHVHDNDQWHDLHQLPFTRDIDFVPVMRALKKIGYKGYLTLEADSYLNAYTGETAFEGCCKMAEAARKLTSMFEAF